MKNNHGLTLVELIVAMAIMSMVFVVLGGFLMFGMKTHKLSADESVVQSTVRLLSTNVNNAIRNSSATFTMYKKNANNLTPNWNYIMVSEDKKTVIKYEWNEIQKKHIASTLMNEVDDTTFKIEYTKKNANSDTDDNLLQFKIIADVKGNKKEIVSELEGLNSLQIVDKRNSNEISNTLAYRFDPRPGEISNSQADVAMVFDTSGSMDRDMGGSNTNVIANKRITKLKTEASRLLEGFADNPNIYVSLNPFSNTANGAMEMLQAQVNTGGVVGANSLLTNAINGMKADGATNTGDGIRRGYHNIVDFNTINEGLSAPKLTKNFMIILVDGDSNYSSVRRVNGTNSWFSWNLENVEDDNFVYGAGNIENKEITHSFFGNDYNKTHTPGRYYNNVNDSNKYIQLLGERLVKSYKNTFNEPITTYVIGFTAQTGGITGLNHIATSTNATGPSSTKKYFEAGDEIALQEVFSKIQKDVNDSLWHIGGPN